MKRILLAVLFLTISNAFAQTPRNFSYQGMLLDISGNPVIGTRDITINLYDSATGGALLHSETFTTSVDKGVFSIVVGSQIPLEPSINFGKQYWLGISIEGLAELSPRTALTSVPYAGHAEITGAVDSSITGGLPSGAIVLFADSAKHAGFTFLALASGSRNWTTGAALPVPQFGMMSAVVNGKIYVIGGQNGARNNNQIYDPVANTWTKGDTLPAPQNGGVCAVVNGKIYVIGGQQGARNDNQIYDPVANTWSTGAPLPVGESEMTCGVVNGKIYVIGGHSDGTKNQIYDPVTNTWAVGTPLPVPQQNLASASVNGKVYVIGGLTADNNQIYDPTTNTWAAGASLPVGQGDMVCASLNGKIYVIGGRNGTQDNNQIYDIVGNTWTVGTPLPVPQNAMTRSVVVNGKIYVIGGLNGTQDNNQIYTPGGLSLFYYMKN